MKIEKTVFDIIAKANNLKQVKDLIYEDDKSNRFIITKFGFQPVDIYNSEYLKSELNKAHEKTKQKLADLKYEADELAHQLSICKSSKSNYDNYELRELFELSNTEDLKTMVNNIKTMVISSKRKISKNSILTKVMVSKFLETNSIEDYRKIKVYIQDSVNNGINDSEIENSFI